jgi:outer membrane protein
MKYSYIISSIILCSNLANAQDKRLKSDSLSLADVWSKVEVNSKVIKGNHYQVERSQENIKIFNDEKLPVINADGTYSRVSNMPVFENGIFNTPSQYHLIHQYYQVGGNADFTIYNGGKIKDGIAKAEIENDIAKAELELSIAEIKYMAASFYYEIYSNRQFQQLLAQDIASSEKLLTEINHLFKNGIVLKSDVLRAEVRLSNQKLSLLAIDNSITIASQHLNMLMGMPDTSGIYPTAADLEHLPDTAQDDRGFLKDAGQDAFDIRIAEKNRMFSALNLKQVKSNLAPRISFFAEYNYTYPQILFYPYSGALYGLGQIGLKANIPLSALYLNKHKEQEAKIALKQQEIALDDRRDRVRLEVESVFLRYTEALNKIEVAQKNIIQASESLRVLNKTYLNQQSLLTDLLNAETLLLQSKFDLTTAKVSARLQYYQLLKITGKI